MTSLLDPKYDYTFHVECAISEGFAFTAGLGTGNDGRVNKQPNAESCQVFCHSQNAPYFKWFAPGTFRGPDFYNSCWCKTGSDKIVAQTNTSSGATCEGNTLKSSLRLSDFPLGKLSQRDFALQMVGAMWI